jgi:hypothetical protein
VDADKYIEERHDRFYVLGTLSEDPDGVERNYKNRTIARAKAREAHGQDPIYKKGDTIPYGSREMVFLQDVTPICALAAVCVSKNQVLWSVKRIIEWEQHLNQEGESDLVIVFEDGLWPKGVSNDKRKEARTK